MDRDLTEEEEQLIEKVATSEVRLKLFRIYTKRPSLSSGALERENFFAVHLPRRLGKLYLNFVYTFLFPLI